MSKYCSIIMTVAALAAVFFAGAVQADVLLFSDTFNSADNAVDYGLNNNLSNRLTGTVTQGPTGMIATGTAWARDYDVTAVDQVQVNSTYGANMLATKGSGSTNAGNAAIIQHNFIDAGITGGGGFTVRFDMDPISQSGSTTKHNHGGCIFLGANDATQSYVGSGGAIQYDVLSDVALQINDQGKLRVRWEDKTSNLGTGAGSATATRFYSNEITFDQDRFNLVGNASDNYTQLYTFEVRVTTDSFAEDAEAALELWVMAKNGFSWTPAAVDLNGALDGNAFTFHWDSGAANYIGFGMGTDNTSWTQFDNVSVTAPIPEPSTLALLAAGLIGLLAYAWRRRK